MTDDIFWGDDTPTAPRPAGFPPLRELGRRLRDGRVSSAELTRRCLGRIAEADALVGAVLVVDGSAPAQAAAADRRLAAGTGRGPLDGIPVLVKDSIDTAGLASTAGSRLLADVPPRTDAEIVQRLRAAGAVVLGKTNLTEWSSFRSTRASEGWSAVGGQTCNPHRPDHSPGGSSSGSAAAVAAGMAPLALGTETDGSVVGPAGACGVAGLKPPPGLLPRRGVVPISETEDCVGLLAPRLEDAVLALAALGGPPAPEPRPPRTLRLGLWRVTGMPRAVNAALDAAAEALRHRGAVVVPVELVLERDLLADGLRAMYAEFRPSVERYLRTRAGVPQTLPDLIAANLADPVELSLFGQDLFETALRVSEDDRAHAVGYRGRAVERATALLDGVLRRHGLDAVLAATNEPAWLVDHQLGDPFSPGSSTAPSLARRPNLTLPLGTAEGLPIGLSVFGPDDLTPLLGAALGIENALRQTAGLLPEFLPIG
ncbi:amidase [Streptacidiphilus sp. MAP12-16]|uniref:amidase family protein n=1 Tax=Streptacidiphilus sp. MAP12-16 TaxID=3156300 RepID=UPI00351411F1